MTKIINQFLSILLVTMLTATLMPSCTLLEENLPECTAHMRLHFKYDYNMQRADMFHDHVGMVRLFAVDHETDLVIKDTIISNRDNNDIIKFSGDRYFTVTLDDLPFDREYKFLAIALQRPYDELEGEAYARGYDHFHGLFPAIGQNEHLLRMNLTHSALPDQNGRYHVTAPSCGLDTLWVGHTIKALNWEDKPFLLVEDTISMVRDTKYLNIALHNLDDDARAAISHEDYEVLITDNNGLIEWDNALIPDADLIYTPHASWTTEALDENEDVNSRAARYELSFSRLVINKNNDPRNNARLRIIRRSDRETVVDIDLAYYLAAGRNAYAWAQYGEQEYLDREYHYSLDFFLRGDRWDYLKLGVNIMPWAIRIQREVL